MSEKFESWTHSKKEAGAIIRNLKDAGCSAEMISNFMEDLREGKTTEGVKLLAIHRRSLLDKLHEEQKRIDCLDYLVYKMGKSKKAGI